MKRSKILSDPEIDRLVEEAAALHGRLMERQRHLSTKSAHYKTLEAQSVALQRFIEDLGRRPPWIVHHATPGSP